MIEPDKARILIIAGDAVHGAWLANVLGPVAISVTCRTSLAGEENEAAFDLVLAEYDSLTGAERRRLIERYSNALASGRLLLFLSSLNRGEFSEVFGARAPPNLLAKNGQLHAADLIVTCRKIIGSDIFGLEKYMHQEALVQRYFIRRSSEKPELLEAAARFAAEAGAQSRFVERFRLVAEEFVTNALFNAPRDAQGNARYSHVARSQPVELDEDEQIEVKLSADSQRLGISTLDRFGSLAQKTLLEYMSKCFRGGKVQVEDKAGGAGLGFVYMFESLSHLVVNLQPGRHTEMIGLLNGLGSFRSFAKHDKSFNLFISNGNST